MHQQESPKSLPLRPALLVLPILALVIYLGLDKYQSHHSAVNMIAANPSSSTQVGAEVGPAVVSNSVKTDSNLVKETAAQAESMITQSKAAQSIATQSENAEVVEALDPDVAKAAVQQVENSVYARATALFEQEPVDPDWAGAYEQSLREMFSHHQGLQKVSVNSINCHATMCRIEVFTPRDSDADYFTAMFYDALERFREGQLKTEAAIARRMEVGMTSVYVARKEHTLGFY